MAVWTTRAADPVAAKEYIYILVRGGQYAMLFMLTLLRKRFRSVGSINATIKHPTTGVIIS